MKILIFDGNNTMYRAYHSYARLQNHGKPVSIIYGMPVLVNAMINQFKPDDVYICWDGARSPERLKLHPAYKQGRKTKTEEEAKAFYNQRDEVQKIFHTLGIKQIVHPQMECDDFIYMLVRKLQKDKNNKITIISTDKDFHQLLRSNVKIYNTAMKRLIHKNNLKVEFGYEPKQCVDYLCLVGDDSDNIPGIRGVGPSKAAGLIQNFSSISNFLKSEEQFAKIDKEKLASTYKLNRQLIDLKFFYKTFMKGKQKITYYNGVKEPKLNTDLLFRICNKYAIKALKKNNFLKNYR